MGDPDVKIIGRLQKNQQQHKSNGIRPPGNSNQNRIFGFKHFEFTDRVFNGAVKVFFQFSRFHDSTGKKRLSGFRQEAGCPALFKKSRDSLFPGLSDIF